MGAGVLNEIVSEMESRYQLFRQHRVRKLSEYNEQDDIE